MDVYGRSGNYFRNNCWWWRPLWNYVSNECKEVISQEDYDSGNYNDGHRVDYEKCEFIVEKLQKLVDDGSVKEYEKSYKKHLEELRMQRRDAAIIWDEINDKDLDDEDIREVIRSHNFGTLLGEIS